MLRIMTYNVHRCIGADGHADPRRIAEVIAGCKPDIVALQELDVGRRRTGGIDQAHAIAHHLGMGFHFHPAVEVEEERYGDAILTCLPMRLIQAERLPGSSLLEPRGAIWIAVKADESELQIINTHLGLVAYERLMQVDTLLGPRWVGHPSCRDPIILLGDFNAMRRSRVYRRLSSRLRDAQLGLHHRPWRTFPARMPMLRIDHIFCSLSVEVLSVDAPRTRLGRIASDHLPLVMDFRVARGRTAASHETLPQLWNLRLPSSVGILDGAAWRPAPRARYPHPSTADAAVSRLAGEEMEEMEAPGEVTAWLGGTPAFTRGETGAW